MVKSKELRSPCCNAPVVKVYTGPEHSGYQCAECEDFIERDEVEK